MAEDIEAKIAKVQELLPKLKDPKNLAKAQQFLAAHGVEQRTGFIGSGEGVQQEGLGPLEGKLTTRDTRSEPKQPEQSPAEKVAKGAAAVALGLDNGVTLGIGHRLMAAPDIPNPLLTERGKRVSEDIAGLTKREPLFPSLSGNASENMASIEKEHPMLSVAGTLGSMGIGGLPAYFEGAAKSILEAIGSKVGGRFGAMMGAPASAMAAKAAQKALGGAATGVASGATADAAQAVDEGLRHPEQDRGPIGERLAAEGEKLAIQALLTGGTGALFGALGARAAATRDPMTNAGSGGVAHKVARLEARGGKLGISGVTPPKSIEPLYAEAMAGGQELPEPIGASKMSEGPYQPGAVGDLMRNTNPPEVTRPALAVQDIAAEKALAPVQAGIASTKTDYLKRIQNAQDRFLGSSAQYQQVEPVEVVDVLKKYIKARTFTEGSPVPYANSGEPIHELNKLLVVGDPVSSAESAAALQRNPGSIRMPVQEAVRLGLRVNGASEAAHDAWVVAEPRKLNPEQFESAMQGINKAAAESKVPDALHADLQQAGFKVRQKFEWPADAGPKPGNYQIGNRGKGLETVNGWAAVQARAHDLMSETETNLYRIGTNPADALSETRGADAIRNSLRSMGEPGRNRADDALWRFALEAPGGRKALQDMEAINTIEGPSGLRSKTEFSGVNPLSTHNRKALGLRLDPLLQMAGRAPTTAAVAARAEAFWPYLQQLLQGISARMGR